MEAIERHALPGVDTTRPSRRSWPFQALLVGSTLVSAIHCAPGEHREQQRSGRAAECDSSIVVVRAPGVTARPRDLCSLATRARRAWYDSAWTKFGVDTLRIGKADTVLVTSLKVAPATGRGGDSLGPEMGGGRERLFWALTIRLANGPQDGAVLIDRPSGVLFVSMTHK